MFWVPANPTTVGDELEELPGKLLEEQGLGDEPSPSVDDEIAAAAKRLLDIHD